MISADQTSRPRSDHDFCMECGGEFFIGELATSDRKRWLAGNKTLLLCRKCVDYYAAEAKRPRKSRLN